MFGFRLKKICIPVFMAISLFFNVQTAFAAEVTPAVYILAVASYACGMDINAYSPAFLDAYKSYLELEGDTATLNQIKSFETLSWGATVTGMESFTRKLKSFFDKYVGPGDDSLPVYDRRPYAFKFPCKKRSYSGWITDVNEKRISGTPYTDVFSTAPSGYQYLFSDWYAVKITSGVNAGKVMNVKRNIFAPAGSEIVAYYYADGFTKNAIVKFYRWDSAKDDVSDPITLKSAATSYWADTGTLNGKDTSVTASFNWTRFAIRDAMVFPVKAFSYLPYIRNYFRGNGKPFVYPNSAECVIGNYNYSFYQMIHEPFTYVGNTLVLPTDASSAKNLITDFHFGSYGFSTDRFSDGFLNKASFSIGYPFEYTVNYEYDGVQDGSSDITVSSHDRTISTVTPKEKAGYRLAQEPYTPALPAKVNTGANTITVNYESWEYPYTVEYYYDNTLKDKKEFSIPSYDNVVKEVPLLESSGIYKLSESPYSPVLPFTVDDQNHVLKVLYVSPVGQAVTKQVGGVFQNIKKFIVSVFPILIGLILAVFLIIFFVKWFKRVTQKG